MVAWGTEAFTAEAVASVAAGDASIAVGGTATAPTIETGTLDEIAALHPPAAAVAMNGKKITGVANGAAATDAAAVGQLGLQSVATTGTAGYTLVNGTGNIISYTTPNDGAMHRIAIFGQVKVTSAQTGGALVCTFTYPDASGTPSASINAGGAGSGYHGLNNPTFLVAPNTTVTLAQSTAQTGGAAVAWLEIWAA